MDLSDGARRCLKAHSWPRNVRELQNVISSAYATCEDSLITLDNLPKIITVNQKEERIMEDIEHLPLKEKMNRFREDAAGGGAAQQQEYDSCCDISGN